MAQSSEPTFIAKLLNRAHPPATARFIIDEKLHQKPLNLDAKSTNVSDVSARNIRRRRRDESARKQARKSKSKPKPMSAEDKRRTGVHDIGEIERRYDIYKGLHRMWCDYMSDLLGLESLQSAGQPQRSVTPKTAGPQLASADFHGGLVEVIRSRCVDKVGIRGIIIRDTKFTFVIITRANAVKVLPKEHTTFRFEVPFTKNDSRDDDNIVAAASPIHQQQPAYLTFEIHGYQFQHGAPDRASKKFRWHFQSDI